MPSDSQICGKQNSGLIYLYSWINSEETQAKSIKFELWKYNG